MWGGNADPLLELAVGEWGNSSYDSFFFVKYEVRSSPQSGEGTLRETKVCVRKLEKCGLIEEGLAERSIFVIT